MRINDTRIVRTFAMLALLALLVLAGSAFAGTATVSLTPPTLH